jgi:hypothetical protein
MKRFSDGDFLFNGPCGLAFTVNHCCRARVKLLVALTLVVWLAATGIARAQITLMDIGTGTPTPGPNDISQLLTNGNTAATTPTGRPDGLNYYTDNNPPAGQTFTTSSTSTNLISVAIRMAGLDAGGGYGTPATTPTYYLRFYSVSGGTATLLTNHSAANPGFVDGGWLKWNSLSVPLAANSTYAFSFGRRPSNGGWCAQAVASGNRYAGGEIALIPTNGGVMTFGGSHGYDAVFDLGMMSDAPTANTPIVSPKNTVYIGTSVTLTETALGLAPLYYQWRTDGGSGGSLTNIPGANGTNIFATPPTTGTFKYDVIVTNSISSATSSVVTVTVLRPATVTVNPAQPMATMPLEGLGVASAVYYGLLTSPGAAPSVAAAGIKAIRYPGGSYADIFHWQTSTTCGGYVAPGAGFDNFINSLVIPAGAKAIITVNYGSNPACNGGGDTNVAAAWVNYANNVRGLGIKYWEIGNEQGGNGYYGDPGWEYDLHYPFYDGNRANQPSLSPTAYGSNSLQFITAMQAQDPTIKCGVGFDTFRASYNSAVLGQCGSVADFVIIHWYPGGDVLASTAQIISTINSTRTQLTNIVGAVRAGQIGIAVTETGPGSVTGAPASLFAADNFLTWIENGTINVDYQELDNGFLANGTPGVADNTPLGPAYGARMSRMLADVGDTMLKTTSAQSLLRVHATARQDGKTAVMLINTDPLIPIAATVNISGPALANSGVWYQFGRTNFIGANANPSFPVSSNNVSGLGNQFTVSVPPYTMVNLLIPPAPSNTPPVLAAISNRTVNVGQTVAFTTSVTETDLPPQTLTFTLLNGPGNATLNTNSGAFSWRPWVTDAVSINSIMLKVADNGTPSLSTTQSFTVMVNPLAQPNVSSGALNDGEFILQVSGDAGPDYAVQASTNLIDWSTVLINNSAVMPFSFTNSPSSPMQFYRVKVGPPLP